MIIYDGTHDKKPYKDVFGNAIESVAKGDADVIYLDCDLANSFGTHKFWKNNPDQAINMGIAEADAMGVAAGLSAGGLKPYVHTFGPFATRRSFDQSFVSIAYAGNNVRIFGSDAGITAAFNGGTHMPFEDIALMRTIPNSTVMEISDASMLRAIIPLIKDRKGLTYVRTTRKTYPTIYSEDHSFKIGKGEILRDGKDASVFAVGLLLGEALKAADALSKEGIEIRVVDTFTIKPIDVDLVKKCAMETSAIVTAENHNVIGGLGDAVLGVLSDEGLLIKTAKIGVRESFGAVGSQDYLQKKYGLTSDVIANTVKKVLG